MEKTTRHVMLISNVPSNAVAYHSHLLFKKYLHQSTLTSQTSFHITPPTSWLLLAHRPKLCLGHDVKLPCEDKAAEKISCQMFLHFRAVLRAECLKG